MTGFYSILKRTIIDRGIGDRSERDEIYSQARRAMIRKLLSFDPPLAEDEIEQRIASFDHAVRDIEADVAAALAQADEAAAETAAEDARPDTDDDPFAAPEYEPAYDVGRGTVDDDEVDYEAQDDQETAYGDVHDTGYAYAEAGHGQGDDDEELRYGELPYRQTEYPQADEAEPEDYPVVRTQLPALVSPAAFGARVREAGLASYYEGAPRVSHYEEARPLDDDQTGSDEPSDDGYREAAEEPPAEALPLAGRIRALATRGRRGRRIPADADDERDDDLRGEAPPRSRRPQRPTPNDRWFADYRESPRGEPQRPPGSNTEGADDNLPRRRRRPKPVQRRPLSERDKILLLLGAIGVSVLVLGGIGVYVLIPRDTGVTVAIDTNGAVSDAATAVRLAAQPLPISQSFMLFDGRDPTIFETSPDNPLHFDSSTGTVRIASSTRSPGVKTLIGPGLASRLAGHNVRVTIVARASKDTGAASMRFAYQSGVAISHWQTAALGPDYQSVALTWRVPKMRTDQSGDYLVIQPGVPGDGTGADIKSIRIDLLAS
jgi:hypothetical protein